MALVEERDDRTLRTLATLVGAARAELAFTHFMQARVLLSVSPRALMAPNGRLAFAVSANMLTRFVGALDCWVPVTDVPDGAEFADRLNADLRAMDTRPEKSVRVVDDRAMPTSYVYAAWLHIGSDDGPVANLTPVRISCDAWRCWLKSGGPIGEVVSSSTPFGALMAACFGVAEVFKMILVNAAPDTSARTAFERRLVPELCYSAWTADWVDEASSEVADSTAPNCRAAPEIAQLLPPGAVLDVDGVLQVGAGAVGNASVLALAALPRVVCGIVDVADPKGVDTKNLNRCLLFREEHVGCLKVDVIVEQARSGPVTVRGDAAEARANQLENAWLLLSTVDNNAVRHAMQEAVPAWLVQGSTNGTQVCISVHNGFGTASCLVCRHPDPEQGTARRRALTVAETAARLGVPAATIVESEYQGNRDVSTAFLNAVAAADPEALGFFEAERAAGADLCGALGRFRQQFGFTKGPDEPTVPFASAFAGFQAAAETVKLAMVRAGVPSVPVLRNVLQLDLARYYTRAPLSFHEPPRADCQLCQFRGDEVRTLYARKWGS
jgi:molybdopterin/thiamine biosynthesis adenylyltransferase